MTEGLTQKRPQLDLGLVYIFQGKKSSEQWNGKQRGAEIELCTWKPSCAVWKRREAESSSSTARGGWSRRRLQRRPGKILYATAKHLFPRHTTHRKDSLQDDTLVRHSVRSTGQSNREVCLQQKQHLKGGRAMKEPFDKA